MRIILAFTLIQFYSVFVGAEIGIADNQALLLGVVEESSIYSVSYKQFEGDGEVTLNKRQTRRRELKKTHAGNYYLTAIKPNYFNVDIQLYSGPYDIGSTYLLRPNAVTYIGDWSLGELEQSKPTRSVDVQYSEETLIDFLKKAPELSKYKLFISTGSNDSSEIKWPDL